VAGTEQTLDSRTRANLAGHTRELDSGDRFAFGSNWQRFLTVLDDERIAEAMRSLKLMLEVEDLRGSSFLDIGSGSGLFSLAAIRLGADRVHSFDFDPDSVACTTELRRRYADDAESWTVEVGSALDGNYIRSLGQWDVVYSWGVQHHTGRMWDGLELAGSAVAPGGRLFISIYNDQGLKSRIWWRIKRTYNRLPVRLRTPYAVAVMAPREALTAGLALARMRPRRYLEAWTSKRARGMSRWHDLIDWVGGFPFEVAKPEQVFEFFRRRGFELTKLKTCRGGLGCNEYVFRKPPT
jgi:SAM-dependent methyltransferase